MSKTRKKMSKGGAHAKGATHARAAPQAKAIAAADQENARLRDERASAPDGMTASERAVAAAGGNKAPRSKPARRTKAAAGKHKRGGILDGAVAVLLSAKDPLGCKDMVESMLERKLWATNGQTPAATLYAAILREIQRKGKQARFEKVARGRFTLRKEA